MGGVLAALLILSKPNFTHPLFSTKQALDFLHFNQRRLLRPSGLLQCRLSYQKKSIACSATPMELPPSLLPGLKFSDWVWV